MSQRYLRKRGETPVFLYPYTETLAKRQDMYECDKDGNFLGTPEGGDEKDMRIAELESELEKYRASDSGVMMESLQAENAALKEENESLQAELEALRTPQDAPQDDQSDEQEPAKSNGVDPKAYVQEVTDKVDQMAQDKDALEKYVKSEFGFDLDKRGSWQKLREKALELAQTKASA